MSEPHDYPLYTNDEPPRIQQAEVIEVVRVVYLEGRGSVMDTLRRVTAHYTLDGTLIACDDPFRPAPESHIP